MLIFPSFYFNFSYTFAHITKKNSLSSYGNFIQIFQEIEEKDKKEKSIFRKENPEMDRQNHFVSVYFQRFRYYFVPLGKSAHNTFDDYPKSYRGSTHQKGMG